MQNTELIPDKELQNLARYLELLKAGSAAMLELARNADVVRLPKTGGGSTSKTAAQTDERVNALEKELNRLYDERARLLTRMDAEVRKVAQSNAVSRAEQNKSNAEMRLTAKESLATANSVEALRVKISQLKVTWASLDMDTPEFKQAGKDLLDLTQKVTAAEMSVGQFGRNVGNYASGFSPLSFQVQQVARELPSLTHSLPQFFLAISNNLPMLADEIGNVRAANAAALKEGKETIPVGKQILSSILSWRTALVVGITLIVANGKAIGEWVQKVIKGKDAALDMAGALDEVNKKLDYKDVGEAATKLEELRRAWVALGGDIQKQEKFIKDTKDEFDDLGVSVTTVEEAENLLITNTQTFIKAMQQRAVQLATADLAAEKYAEYLRKLDEAEDMLANDKPNFGDYFKALSVWDPTRADESIREVARVFQRARQRAVEGEADALKSEFDQFTEIGRKAANEYFALWGEGGFKEIEKPDKKHTKETVKNSRIRLSALNDERKALEDLSVAEIDENIGVINRALALNKASVAERMSLIDDLYDLEEQRARKLYEIQRDNLIQKNIDENTTYNKDGSIASTITREKAEENTANQLKALWLAYDTTIVESVESRNQKLRALEDKRVQDAIRSVQKHLNTLDRALQEGESTEMTDLSAEFAKGLISREDYEQKQLEITRRYADLRSQSELDSMQERLDAMKSDPYKTIDEEQAILGLEQAIADKEVEIQVEKNDRIIEDNERMHDRISEAAKMAFSGLLDLTTELVNLQTERQLAAIDKQLEASQKATDEEIDRIDRLYDHGAITEEQANARKAKAEQEQVVLEEQLAQKRAAIQKRQARMSVIVNTAQAIMSAALTQPFIPLGLIAVGTATALGAMQLTAVDAATYAHGTPEGGHPGGLAWVGDGGRSEMVLTGGRAYKTPALPTLVDLPRGAEVLPSYDQAMRDIVIANALTPLRRLPSDMPKAAEPYNDGNVLRELREHRAMTAKVVRAIERQTADRRFKELKNRSLFKVN